MQLPHRESRRSFDRVLRALTHKGKHRRAPRERWPSREDVDIPGLARDAVTAFTPAAAVKGNRINLTCDDALAACVTDGAKIDFCLRTLLTHAIAFTRSGVINVRAAAREIDGQDCFCLEVEDSGPPIDQAAIDNLFEPFAQSEDAKGGRCDGANLGLALSLRMIRLLGGDLIAMPAASGGICFLLSAPIDLNMWKRRGDAVAA